MSVPLVLILLAAPLRAQAPAPSSGTYAEADRLYFSRNEPGHLEQADTLLRERLKAKEEEPALWRLSRCLVRRGEREKDATKKLALFQEAEKVSLRAVELDPKDSQSHFSLGLAYGRRGEIQGIMHSLFLVKPIRKEMEATLALKPDHSGAYHVLGEMLLRLPRMAGGSKSQGLAYLEKALAAAPNNTSIHCDLAEAYLDAGKKDKARAVVERLLAVTAPDDPAEYPDNAAEGRKLLERLK
jgi:hypothetical protein